MELNKGTTVFCIVKNPSTFQMEVAKGTVTAIGERKNLGADDPCIVVERKDSPLNSTRWEFPIYAPGQAIFLTQEDADAALPNWTGYKEDEGK